MNWAGSRLVIAGPGRPDVGSGNLVHNLGMVAWDHLNDAYAYDWAAEARTRMNALIMAGDHARLQDPHALGKAFQLAIPTPEHYLPVLYALALQQKDEGPCSSTTNRSADR